MNLAPSNSNPRNDTVREAQMMLNYISSSCHHGWPYLAQDGIYGGISASVILSFQRYRGISSIQTKDGPTLDDRTLSYLRESYHTVKHILGQRAGTISAPQCTYRWEASTTAKRAATVQTQIGTCRKFDIPDSVTTVYSGVSTSVKTVIGAEDLIYKPVLEMLKMENVLSTQAGNLTRRIRRIPKNARMRHLLDALDKSQKYIEKAKRSGVTVAAKQVYGSITKDTVITFLKDTSKAILESPTYKFLSKSKDIFLKIKKALQPVFNWLKKFPFLKYLGCIEKLVRAAWHCINCNYEKAWQLFVDSIRELIEAIVVGVAVGAAIALGGWIGILLTIVVIIGSALVDYFFFNENTGDTLVEKHTQLRTYNVIQDSVAPWMAQQLHR